MGWLSKKYREMQNMKQGRNADGTSHFSEEDLKKYTGKDRAEMDKFAATTPGVAGNQNAGSIMVGATSGLYAGNYHTYDGHKIPKNK